MEKEQTLLWIVAIVAVVAIVAMIALTREQASLPSNTLSGDAMSFCYENTYYTYQGASAMGSHDYICCYAISGGGNIVWHVWGESGFNFGVSGKAPRECWINGIRG